MKSKINKIFLTIFFIKILLFVNSCTSTHRLFTSSQLPAEKIAILKYGELGSFPIKLVSIDENKEKAEQINNSWGDWKIIEFLPGTYKIRVRLSKYESLSASAGWIIKSTADKNILFKAEAGHTYRLMYKLQTLDWYVWIEDVTKVE